MADVKNWLAGFVYRGRAPWETEETAYHVEVGEFVEVEGRDPVNLGTKVLTPDQAAAAGFALPQALAAIDKAALTEVQALRAAVSTITAQNVEAAQRAASLEAALAQAQSDLAAVTAKQTARAIDETATSPA